MIVRRCITGAAITALAATGLVACSGSDSDSGDSTKTETSTTTSTAADKESTSAKADADGEAISITDVEGRTVKFDKKPERIVLAEGRGVFATSLLDNKNPMDKIVAIGTDLKGNVPDFYKKLVDKIPEAKDIPEIGNLKKGDVTVENLLTFNPDALVMSTDQYKAAQKAGTLEQIENSGLKYVVTDFRQHPLENTPKSVKVYGQLLGKEDKAEAFLKDWQGTLDEVKEKATKLTDKPSVFVWRAAGLKDCCATWNNANISELVNFAGGDNIGDGILDGQAGDLTPEKVIEMQPKYIIATGGDWGAKKKDGKTPAYAAAGYDIDSSTAAASLDKLLENQPGFELLDAPKEGNFHAIWHQFYDSPMNYLALLQIAAWINPEEYKDLDMQKKWDEAHEKYMPFGGEGTFFLNQN